MELYVRNTLVILMMICSVSSGVLVAGPKFVLPNQEYTLTISNDKGLSPSVKLNLTLEVIDDANTTYHSTVVDVRKHTLRNVKLAIPNVTPATSLRLTIDGLHDFRYHEVVTLEVRASLLSGLIQTDKPVYKPGDTVKFRVIVLDTELKPPAKLESVRVAIRDPKGSTIRQWDSAKLFSGVFENRLQVASNPMLGLWTVVACVDQQEIVSKSFEVREYVLTSFDLQVVPSVIPLLQHHGLNLTIAAYYHFGKPVAGTAVVELHLSHDILDEKRTFDMFGTGQTNIVFKNALDMPDDHENVLVKVSFTEKHTRRTVSKDISVPVYKHPYRVKLVPEAPMFRAGRPFKCTLQFTKHDGTQANGIAGVVEIDELQYNEKHTSDSSGCIKLNLLMNNASESIHITFTESDSTGYYMFEETVHRTDSDDTFIKLELRSQPNIKSTKPMSLVVTCSERMSSFVYYVLSKGKIIDARLILLNSQTKYRMNQIRASEKMLPKASIIVITVANNNTLVWDSLDVSFPQFGNSLDIRVDETELRPSGPVKLTLRGRPGSYVGLTAYDKSLLQSSQHHHDIVWEDIEELFKRFYEVESTEFDPFNSMGMFVRSPTQPTAHYGDRYRRSLFNAHQPPVKLTVYRTSFPESWLWKNVSMGNTEKLALHEYVPDSTTTWYLTGFAISPEHGLGIVKSPIQLVTSKPFYVVESLPYSIKRGEAVVLQFTLFSNLGAEYVANVTLFNVDQQMEFFNQTHIAYTKSLSVPPGVGTPVSFLVKARKLGEMVIRVRASLMNGAETDALEKFVRVLPENLVYNYTINQFFQVEYDKKFSKNHSLDVHKQRNKNSLHVVLTMYPNILTTVIDNLDNLLGTPKGSAVLSLIDVIPSLVVLEYLVANGSTTYEDHSTINKTKTILTNCLQTVAKYRQPDGSFGDWPDSKQGSIFVTALAAQSLSWSSKYIEIDKEMARGAFLWLATKQTSSGRYDEVSEITYQVLQDGSRQGIALTSYVMIVFLENVLFVNNDSIKHAIAAGINYIAGSLSSITDVHDLSLATYALMLNNHGDKEIFHNKLIEKSHFDNTTIERHWPRSSAAVETTAYALLCYYENRQYVDGIAIMRWLVNQRDASGGFSSPQATFVGLHALAKLTRVLRSNNTYQVVVVEKGATPKHFRVQTTDLNQRYEHRWDSISKEITINITGKGLGMYHLSHEYTVDVRNISKQFNLAVNTSYTNYTLILEVCTSYDAAISFQRSNIALVEVNFPSGFVGDKRSIKNLSENANKIQNYEFRYGQTALVVYYSSMGPEKNCFEVHAHRRFEVIFHRPSYVLVYDTFNPSQRHNFIEQ
uniref:TEP1-F n=1 Tax=Anopheles farauti TaxID=69004 RepID=A0A182QYC9_9DIPT